ncbi:MAG: hypothetical protein KAV41_01870 [Candidatus Pacebacteria bacterium]|nr:hypothetical protein [Candidatus Paceibacterota bacterium]
MKKLMMIGGVGFVAVFLFSVSVFAQSARMEIEKNSADGEIRLILMAEEQVFEKTGIFVSQEASQYPAEWKEVYNDLGKEIPLISGGRTKYKMEGIFYWIPIQKYEKIVLYDESVNTIVVKQKEGKIEGKKMFARFLALWGVAMFFVWLANLSKTRDVMIAYVVLSALINVVLVLVNFAIGFSISAFFIAFALAAIYFIFKFKHKASFEYKIANELFYTFMVAGLVFLYL